MHKILCIGEEWRGSNSSGLFYALSRIGHQIELVNELNYISLNGKSFQSKFFNKLIRYPQIKDFNEQIIEKAKQVKPDIIFIYKGAFIFPETLKTLKMEGHLLINFYPDVSLFTHGSYIPKCIPLYDHIFTTKSFAIRDLKNKFNYENVTFIPHGYDPSLHNIDKLQKQSLFSCDVSFIGTWSPKKERILSHIANYIPELNMKIWGNQWQKCTTSSLASAIQGVALFGDQYVEAIQHSKINLGILSEVRKGASSGDLITSRTFHIPASGGFMLHEKTDEVLLYFKEGLEFVSYVDIYDLIDKIIYYLKQSEERELVAKMGLKRAQNDHSLDQRALEIINILKNITNIKSEY
ncbi:MAG: glycosyltransferase [Fulvivirga sp.]|uniref:CgeB family protein n=1 Tax=Fulvivirga sp. TaxID=1931237 RepID=UPI0032ED0C0D